MPVHQLNRRPTAGLIPRPPHMSCHHRPSPTPEGTISLWLGTSSELRRRPKFQNKIVAIKAQRMSSTAPCKDHLKSTFDTIMMRWRHAQMMKLHRLVTRI